MSFSKVIVDRPGPFQIKIDKYGEPTNLRNSKSRARQEKRIEELNSVRKMESTLNFMHENKRGYEIVVFNSKRAPSEGSSVPAIQRMVMGYYKDCSAKA